VNPNLADVIPNSPRFYQVDGVILSAAFFSGAKDLRYDAVCHRRSRYPFS
jgi:hypothetical protein